MLEKDKKWSWGKRVAAGLAFITMAGFVIGVTVATGGQALWGFVPIWIVDAGSKAYGFPIPFALTALVFASLTGFYEYIGQSIYDLFKSSDVDEQQPLLNANDISISVRSLDQNALLTASRQQLSRIQDIESALQQEEERQNSQLPPLVHINSPEEIPTLQTHIQSNIRNDSNSIAVSIETGFFSSPTTPSTPPVISAQQIENLDRINSRAEKKCTIL